VATVVNTVVLDQARLAGLLAPRTDVVDEVPDGEGGFVLDRGPFSQYRRTVSVEPDAQDPTRSRVTETTTFRLAVPFWRVLFIWPFKHALRSVDRRQDRRQPAWAPPDLMDARSATVLGALCSAALVAGYLGTVITQTITYAAGQFGNSAGDQANTLANVRVGALLAMVLVGAADRRGRRGILLFSAATSCVVTAAGALAPNLLLLGVSQVVAGGLTTTLLLLLAIIAAEEMPAGSRAYAISVMTMTGALGAGMCLWALPLADTGPGGWRILYVLPLLFLPLLLHVSRHLPESRRFVAPHRDATVVTNHARRFWVLGTMFFLVSAFGAPATQLLNEFLRTDRGFSASRISLFTILTSTPGFIGLIIGGRIADVKGRRIIVTIGIVFGALLTVFSFSSHGWPMWAWNLVGTVLAATAGPALSLYAPELFPTGSRARANGIIRAVSVAGSYVGLRLVGRLVTHADLGHAMAIILVGPVIAGGLVLFLIPETARRELEDINPEDQPLPVRGGQLGATDRDTDTTATGSGNPLS